jgi:hypothetical protein
MSKFGTILSVTLRSIVGALLWPAFIISIFSN